MNRRSLVLELQDMASSPDIDIATLLRKAMLVATKLKLEEFLAWIGLELNGYGEATLPAYRVVHATLHLRHRTYGSIPLIIEDPKEAEPMQTVFVRDPIGNLSHLLKNPSDGTMRVAMPDSLAARIMRKQPRHIQLPPFRCVSTGAVATIVDAVRTKILDWSLKLEAEGILGEDMQFSESERHIAASHQTVHIANVHSFHGNIGNAGGGSQVSQDSSIHVSAGDFGSLANELTKLGVPTEEIETLRQAINEDDRPSGPNDFGPKTGDWIGRMVSKAANGGLQVGVGAAGNLLAKAILAYYGIG